MFMLALANTFLKIVDLGLLVQSEDWIYLMTRSSCHMGAIPSKASLFATAPSQRILLLPLLYFEAHTYSTLRLSDLERIDPYHTMGINNSDTVFLCFPALSFFLSAFALEKSTTLMLSV